MRHSQVCKQLFVMTLLVFTQGQATAQAPRPEGAGEAMLEQVMKRGVLRVGMSTFVPWAMQDKSGNFIGFEIDASEYIVFGVAGHGVALTGHAIPGRADPG